MNQKNYINGDEIYFEGNLYDLPSMNFEQKFLVLTKAGDDENDKKIIDAILATILNIRILNCIFFSEECAVCSYLEDSLLYRNDEIALIETEGEKVNLWYISDEEKLELLLKNKNNPEVASKIIMNINSLKVLEKCPPIEGTTLTYVSKMHELKGLLNDELPKKMKRSRIR